jgi:hypothetical protein
MVSEYQMNARRDWISVAPKPEDRQQTLSRRRQGGIEVFWRGGGHKTATAACDFGFVACGMIERL